MNSVQHSTTPSAVKTLARRLVRDERGATLMEYLMLAGLVAIAAFVGFKTFGTNVNDTITDQANKINELKP